MVLSWALVVCKGWAAQVELQEGAKGKTGEVPRDKASLRQCQRSVGEVLQSRARTPSGDGGNASALPLTRHHSHARRSGVRRGGGPPIPGGHWAAVDAVDGHAVGAGPDQRLPRRRPGPARPRAPSVGGVVLRLH